MKKKILSALLILAIVISIATTTFADTQGDIKNLINEVQEVDNGTGLSESANSIVGAVNVIYTIIRAAGTGIALLMVIVLGIKYMMTSVEEKAEIKKQAIPILVGSGFIFATSQLLGIVAEIVKGL